MRKQPSKHSGKLMVLAFMALVAGIVLATLLGEWFPLWIGVGLFIVLAALEAGLREKQERLAPRTVQEVARERGWDRDGESRYWKERP